MNIIARFRLGILSAIFMLWLLAPVTPVFAQGPLPPRPPADVPEADTLLLLLAGGSGGATYLWWRWRKR